MNSPQSNAPASESESGAPREDVRERAERLHEKVGELSKTLDRIDEFLADGGGEPEKSE